VQPSDIVTRKLHNLQVTTPGNCATSGYRNPEVVQPPGYNIRKLSNQVKGKLLLFVSKSLKNHLHSHFQPQPPGIITRRLHNLRVTIPGNCATSGFVTRKSLQKKPFLWISMRKQNIFQKYFWGLLKFLCTIDLCKKPELENLMLLSL